MKTPNYQPERELELAGGEAAVLSGHAAPRPNRGSLRSKLVLSLGAMFLVFLVVDEIVRQQVIKPSFVRLEYSGAIRDANRVLAAIDVEAEYMMEIGEQLAARIDPSEMSIAGQDTGIGNDRAANPWRTQRVAWIAVVGADGSWRWLHQDPKLNAIAPPHAGFSAVDRLIRESQGHTLKGKARFANNLYMFAGAPIKRDPAATHDYLVVGRAAGRGNGASHWETHTSRFLVAVVPPSTSEQAVRCLGSRRIHAGR